MGLSSAWGSFWAGDFKQAADLAFIPEEDIAAGQDVDKRIADFNSTAEPYAQIQNTPFLDVVKQNSPSSAFVESYNEQLRSVSQSLSNATGNVLWETIKALRYFILIAAIIGLGYLFLISREAKAAKI